VSSAADATPVRCDRRPFQRLIVADGMADGDFAAGDPDEVTRAVLNATSRFHDPMHAAEWGSPEIGADSEGVVSLILDGIRAR
jgi:pyridoxal biosynthesis lyase PdxS